MDRLLFMDPFGFGSRRPFFRGRRSLGTIDPLPFARIAENYSAETEDAGSHGQNVPVYVDFDLERTDSSRIPRIVPRGRSRTYSDSSRIRELPVRVETLSRNRQDRDLNSEPPERRESAFRTSSFRDRRNPWDVDIPIQVDHNSTRRENVRHDSDDERPRDHQSGGSENSEPANNGIITLNLSTQIIIFN